MTEVRSYHGQPVLKEPIWTWEIPCYFFSGGLAGASAGLAYLVELRGNKVLGRRAWAISMAGVIASPALLISDLGRPARFLNMLRMFKPTSPMSVGSWILTASGATTSLSAINAWTGLFPTSAKVAKPAAALLGLPLSSYTAALVANTAIPVWHESHRTLPFMFASGAALSAAAAAVATTPPDHAAQARRLALIAALCEGASNEVMRKALGDQAQPYKTGLASHLGDLSRGCAVTGTALLARRGSRSRAAAALAGGLLLAAALGRRWSVFKAGVQGASSPEHVIAPQRQRVDRGEARGAARRQANVSTPDHELASPATSPSA